MVKIWAFWFGVGMFLSACNQQPNPTVKEQPHTDTVLKPTASAGASLEDSANAKAVKVSYAEGYSEKDFGDTYEMFPADVDADAKPQTDGLWEVFLKLTYEIKFDERIDDIAYIPKFTPEIKKYEGKEIEIKGYILPHDLTKTAKGMNGKGEMFMFSAFPAATCFFCGAAGPESVMEVFPKKPIPYSKYPVKIKGRLELNDKDFLRMSYIIKDARLVE